MEDLACLARDHIQFCHPVITIQDMYTCTVNIPADIILKLERFVVLMYDRTIFDIHVNEARMTLFSQMSCNVDNIPPTQAAFKTNISRDHPTNECSVGPSLEVQPGLPDVTD